jgi:hypothetical protein
MTAARKYNCEVIMQDLNCDLQTSARTIDAVAYLGIWILRSLGPVIDLENRLRGRNVSICVYILHWLNLYLSWNATSHKGAVPVSPHLTTAVIVAVPAAVVSVQLPLLLCFVSGTTRTLLSRVHYLIQTKYTTLQLSYELQKLLWVLGDLTAICNTVSMGNKNLNEWFAKTACCWLC